MFGCVYSQHLDLSKRFDKNDNTLSDKEVLSLIIKFTNSEKYRPFEMIEKEKNILNKINVESDFLGAKTESIKLLETQPYNLIANMGIVLYEQIERGNNNYYSNSKYEKLVNAILSSGDGSVEAPYFTLSPIDKEIILRLIISEKSYSRVDLGIDDENKLDVVKVEYNNVKKYYYFESTHLFQQLMKDKE